MMPRLLLSGSSWRGGPAGRATAKLSDKLFPFLLTVDAAAHLLSAVLEYQPALAPWLCCFRLQWVIFNPSIQSVSRNRRRNIRHMLTSAPRRCGGVCPSSCWDNPCPSVQDRIRKVCSEWLAITPQASGLHRRGRAQGAKSLPPLCSPAGSWTTACIVQRDRRRDSSLSWVSFRQTSSTAVLGVPQRHGLSHNSHTGAEAFGVRVP